MAKNSTIPGWPDMLQPPFANLAAGFGQGASPGVPGIASGMDVMKGLWGGLPSAVPGFVLPTLDIGELDKRIEDLRSVESWLALNANMLKATIQGLEVQRNTLAALAALRDKGDFLSAMMKPSAAASARSAEPDASDSDDSTAPPSSPDKSTSKAAFAEAFRQSFGAHAGNPNWPLPLDRSEAAPEAPEIDDEPPPYVAPRKAKKSVGKKAHKARSKASTASGAAAALGVSNSGASQSANLWMNFLKDQFGQIANAALVNPASASTAKAAPSPARPAARPVAKSRSLKGATRLAKAAKARPSGRSAPAVKASARRTTSGAKR